MVLPIVSVMLIALSLGGEAIAQSRPQPTFEDQLYMIGRAQEDELRQLRKENEELKKKIDELKGQISKGEQK